MNPEYIRFWIEKNDWLEGSEEEIEAILPRLVSAFPWGGIVQGTATSLRRLWPLFEKFWKRSEIVLMGKLSTWFQGLDLSAPSSFLREDRWAEFAGYESVHGIPRGARGIDAESWTRDFILTEPNPDQIQRVARLFRRQAQSRLQVYYYGPGLWGDDMRRNNLCKATFSNPQSEILWHNGRYADPTPTPAAIAYADESDLICRVRQFTKCNCGDHADSQYTPATLAARMDGLPKPVYCYFGGAANVAPWGNEMEAFLKGTT